MITNFSKEQLATSYKKMINKIIINDQNVLTNFTASVENNTCSVQFNVPEGVTELKRIRLYQDETLLSDCSLYVPIVGDTIFRYKCEVM